MHYRAFDILREIVTILLDFSVDKHGVCRGCALGKNVKADFPRNENRYKGSLDIIQLDVCGKMSVASVQGESYYVTFLVDFSKKT